MLTELQIKNFRAFKELSAKGLTRVNLFVGGNNSGKTTLLEAAEILLSEETVERTNKSCVSWYNLLLKS